jgi:hypothetical protein
LDVKCAAGGARLKAYPTKEPGGKGRVGKKKEGPYDDKEKKHNAKKNKY